MTIVDFHHQQQKGKRDACRQHAARGWSTAGFTAWDDYLATFDGQAANDAAIAAVQATSLPGLQAARQLVIDTALVRRRARTQFVAEAARTATRADVDRHAFLHDQVIGAMLDLEDQRLRLLSGSDTGA